jgi:hypothetical protein
MLVSARPPQTVICPKSNFTATKIQRFSAQSRILTAFQSTAATDSKSPEYPDKAVPAAKSKPETTPKTHSVNASRSPGIGRPPRVRRSPISHPANRATAVTATANT